MFLSGVLLFSLGTGREEDQQSQTEAVNGLLNGGPKEPHSRYFGYVSSPMGVDCCYPHYLDK